MNIKNLRNKARGIKVTEDGNRVRFEGGGLGYSVPRRKATGQMAEYIRSKIPVATILPPR